MQRILISLAFLFLGGCVPLILGTGVVTGYILSNDSAIGTIQASYREVWDACTQTLEEEGIGIIEANESKGKIRAKIYDYDLAIRIDTLDSESQRLKISARKYLLPKPQYAQKIFFKIAKRLE